MPNLREFLNNNSMIATLVAVLILVISLIIVFRQVSGPRRSPGDYKAYYYVLETGERITAPLAQIPPIMTEDGNEAVRAMVFDCGKCENESDFFIGYLLRYTPEGKQKQQELLERYQDPGLSEEEREGLVVMEEVDTSQWQEVARLQKPLKWVLLSDPASQEVRNVRGRCEGERVQQCYPK